MRGGIQLGKPLAYDRHGEPRSAACTAADWWCMGRSIWGPAAGRFGQEGWRCFRRATGPGEAGLRSLHVNARAEAISGRQELLRAAAGPNLWLRAILGSTPRSRSWTPTSANGALVSQTNTTQPTRYHLRVVRYPPLAVWAQPGWHRPHFADFAPI
jgi:hypothetical protein